MGNSQGILEAMQLDREFLKENHYYLTIEIAKQFNSFVFLVVEANKKDKTRMNVIYSCARVGREIFLDNKGFFTDLRDRNIVVDGKRTVPLILSVDGAHKVLEDNGYRVTDVDNKKICREWVRNNTPVFSLYTLGSANIKIKEYAMFLLSHNSLVDSDTILECDDFTNSLISPVVFEMKNGVYGYIDDKKAFLPLRTVVTHFKDSRGWISNPKWYTKYKSELSKGGVQ